jgi:predicted SAM-dependent methyltransferase
MAETVRFTGAWAGSGRLPRQLRPEDARTLLDHYLATCQDGQEGVLQTKPPTTRVRRIVKTMLPMPVMETARAMATTAIGPIARRSARKQTTTGHLQLHLGSGKERKAGWLNIDLLGDPVDLPWNLARGLPFPDGSADAVFHEHLLEHLPLPAAMSMLREIHRVLRPGGLLRIGVPDARLLIDSYRDEPDNGVLSVLRPERPTSMLALQEFFYWYRHKVMYDQETLFLVCSSAGFPDMRAMPFGESELDPCPDTPARRLVSLYVEGRKPA